ncbi:hypothetical protein Bbelb_278460 [Branchiostoma belcheri]|nr:hypothetical protein Bbelb_278460 [Branchiostoma belcheri]
MLSTKWSRVVTGVVAGAAVVGSVGYRKKTSAVGTGQSWLEMARKEAYRPAYNAKPKNYTGPVFKPNFDFPTEEPVLRDENLPWLAIEFKDDPQAYLKSVLDYCFEGNTECDFRVHNNEVRRWYHSPWMASRPFGRERIHGLTMERPCDPGYIDSHDKRWVQTWAVAFYNSFGAYTIGKFWKEPGEPTLTNNVLFPEGTVAFKLLFTQATKYDAPYLEGSKEWEVANGIPFPPIPRNASDSEALNILEKTMTPRYRGDDPHRLRLIQVDVMVRDARAETDDAAFFCADDAGVRADDAAFFCADDAGVRADDAAFFCADDAGVRADDAAFSVLTTRVFAQTTQLFSVSAGVREGDAGVRADDAGVREGDTGVCPGDASVYLLGTVLRPEIGQSAERAPNSINDYCPEEDAWRRLIPMSLQWGNDPDLTQEKYDKGDRPAESWTNPLVKELNLLPKTRPYLGYLERANGVVDNFKSCCSSCHSTASIPAPDPSPPDMVPPDTMKWFRNINAGDPFEGGVKSLDYSLQLDAGLKGFSEWKKPASQVTGRPSPQFPVTGKEEEAVVVWTRNQSEGYLSSHYTAREGGGWTTEGRPRRTWTSDLKEWTGHPLSHLTSLAENRPGWISLVDSLVAPTAGQTAMAPTHAVSIEPSAGAVRIGETSVPLLPRASMVPRVSEVTVCKATVPSANSESTIHTKDELFDWPFEIPDSDYGIAEETDPISLPSTKHKAPSRAQREAAAAVPVPVAVSEGNVATQQGPLSQPGKKVRAARRKPRERANEPGARGEFEADDKRLVEQEKPEEREKWLKRAAEILSYNAIEAAYRELRGEATPGCETLSGHNLSPLRVYPQYSEIGGTQLQRRGLRQDTDSKVVERVLHEVAHVQTKQKGWKAQGKREARRLRRAFSLLLTSCFRRRVAP